ncbi:MAG TPA: ATP-binding protein, partial [Myxococcota bacterium]|nr:ATP-binding protein [Myxococcota bacterium]
ILHLPDQAGAENYEGTVLAVEDFPTYFEALAEGRALRIDDIATDPRAAALRDTYLQPLGIGALLDVPILRDGRAIGVVCHEHYGPPRHWTDAETSLGMAAANSIAVGLADAERSAAQNELSVLRGHHDDAKNLDLLGKMAAGIAHDLNNILTIVAGNAEMLADVGQQSPEALSIIGEIRRSAGRGKDLARDLMELDRTRKSSPRVVSVGQHLVDFARSLDRGLGRHHQVQCRSEGHGRVLIDPRQLERVVMNLVVNARDAMPDGGAVTITVSDVSFADGSTDGSWVRVDVVDTGRGMDAQTAARIFEPFFSTKAAGKGGLGMTIVKDLVTRAGGFVHVESEPDHGTAIRVHLPRVA